MASEGQLVSQVKVGKGLGCAQGSRDFPAVHSVRGTGSFPQYLMWGIVISLTREDH